MLAIGVSLLLHVWLFFVLANSGFPVFESSHVPRGLTVFLRAAPDIVKAEVSCRYPRECDPLEDAHVREEPSFASANGANVTPLPMRDMNATPGLGIPRYYRREELSQPPQALTYPAIRVPEGDDPRIIGSVSLRLFLSDTGLVDEIAVQNATLPEPYVAEIVSAHSKLRFKPGELNGMPVKSQLEFEVDFLVDSRPAKVLRRGR